MAPRVVRRYFRAVLILLCGVLDALDLCSSGGGLAVRDKRDIRKRLFLHERQRRVWHTMAATQSFADTLSQTMAAETIVFEQQRTF